MATTYYFFPSVLFRYATGISRNPTSGCMDTSGVRIVIYRVVVMPLALVDPPERVNKDEVENLLLKKC
jgi:hypothetical protein